ncbi:MULTISPECIES: PorT family protein [Flavobacterium]|uniref:PorT family protein n=1 Tax=Flavobacterium jumunjinense TaxID=998845 RepID=A0ABV5GLM0_9FLAO|nr:MULTISPECIES: PorT family protein [Flavobacterium]
MKENKNIERLFQEKFKDFEATPPSMAWDSIASKLESNKKEKRRIIPLWFKLTGIAASLLLISYGILEFYSTEKKERNTVVTQDKTKDAKESNIKEDILDKGLLLNTKETNESIANDSKNETLKENNTSIHSTVSKENNTVVALEKNKKEKSSKATNEKLRFENKINNNDLVEQNNNIVKSEKASNNTLIINDISNEEIVGLTNLKSEKNTNNELIVQNSDTKKEIIENTNSKETILKNETLVSINSDVQFTDKNSTLDNSNLATHSEETNSTTEKRLALNSNTENNIVVAEDNTNATINSSNDNTNTTINTVVINEKTINTVASTTSNKLKTNNKTGVVTGTIEYNKEIITNKENPITNGNNLGVIKDSTSVIAEVNTEVNALEQLLEQKEEGKNADEKEKEMRNKWVVSSNAAPVYFNSMSEGSPIDEQFTSNNKTYATSVSYGVGVQYALSKKINIRTGINSISLNYNTNNIYYSKSLQESSVASLNVTTNENAQYLVLKSKPTNIASAINMEANGIRYENEANLKQEMGYIEVPLELSYKIIDKKFGIELIGGMSTMFLNKNSISLVTNDSEMNIGEANNLNDIHFSSNVGLGFKYSFWKSFNVDIQPMFKYQINTFDNDSGNFKPYFIGVYSGVSFSF